MDFFVILFDDVALQDLQGPAVLLSLNEEGGKVLALSFDDHCGDDILAGGQSHSLGILILL